MQIHGLSYADMASVQVNESPWFSLNNDTVAVAEPGKSYGGIGGGFATLSVTLMLPAGVVVQGGNKIRFRFNHTDGVASGFRVVAFNLLTSDSKKILDPDAFKQEDPNTWTPPLRDSNSIAAGQEIWENAQLKASALPNSPQIRAHCSDCHAYDGRDLKYFGFSNGSIIARSRFHGLSDLQGRQIASYIRSLPVPSQDVPGILLTSPDPDWMPSRLPTGRPEQGSHGYSTATSPRFHLSSSRTVISRDDQSRRSHRQSCVVRFAPMGT